MRGKTLTGRSEKKPVFLTTSMSSLSFQLDVMIFIWSFFPLPQHSWLKLLQFYHNWMEVVVKESLCLKENLKPPRNLAWEKDFIPCSARNFCHLACWWATPPKLSVLNPSLLQVLWDLWQLPSVLGKKLVFHRFQGWSNISQPALSLGSQRKYILFERLFLSFRFDESNFAWLIFGVLIEKEFSVDTIANVEGLSRAIYRILF